MTELAIIGSDIQEVIGSATALFILFKIPLWIASQIASQIGAIVTILDSLLFLFIHSLLRPLLGYSKGKLEFLFAFLIVVMAISFCVNMIFI